MTRIVFLLIIGTVLLISADVVRSQSPKLAGSRAVFSGGIGNEYLNVATPSSPSVGMNGMDVNLTADFRPRFGIRADVGYAVVRNLYGSHHRGDVLNYFVGPVAYLYRTRRVVLYLDGLVGAARVTGATPTPNGDYVRGMANKLGWAAGGGGEFRVDPNSYLRIGAEYMHTVYFDPNRIIAAQGTVRLIANFVYRFGSERR